MQKYPFVYISDVALKIYFDNVFNPFASLKQQKQTNTILVYCLRLMRNNYLNDIIIVATIHSFYRTHVDNNNNISFMTNYIIGIFLLFLFSII